MRARQVRNNKIMTRGDRARRARVYRVARDIPPSSSSRVQQLSTTIYYLPTAVAAAGWLACVIEFIARAPSSARRPPQSAAVVSAVTRHSRARWQRPPYDCMFLFMRSSYRDDDYYYSCTLTPRPVACTRARVRNNNNYCLYISVPVPGHRIELHALGFSRDFKIRFNSLSLPSSPLTWSRGENRFLISDESWSVIINNNDFTLPQWLTRNQKKKVLYCCQESLVRAKLKKKYTYIFIDTFYSNQIFLHAHSNINCAEHFYYCVDVSFYEQIAKYLYLT